MRLFFGLVVARLEDFLGPEGAEALRIKVRAQQLDAVHKGDSSWADLVTDSAIDALDDACSVGLQVVTLPPVGGHGIGGKRGGTVAIIYGE